MPDESQLRRNDFSNLVREYQAGLRAFIRALGVEAAWVDDLAQETFVVAYRSFDNFQNDKDFGKWLRGIARNLVANERRKEARRARILSSPFTELMLEERASAALEDKPETTRIVQAMNECIEQLPERSRELLRKRYEADQNASTLSVLFEMRPDAIRQSLTRIRILVKECIESKMAWP